MGLMNIGRSVLRIARYESIRLGGFRHGGLIEVPMGDDMNQIIEDIGGGVEGGEKLRGHTDRWPFGLGCIPLIYVMRRWILTHLSNGERLWVPGNGRIERAIVYGGCGSLFLGVYL